MDHLYEKKSATMCRVKAGASIDTEGRTLEAVISSNQVDRDGEVIEPRAFEKRLETFKQNPVLLSNHEPMAPTPIGRVEELEIGENTLEAKVRFRPEGDSAIADDIFKAYAGGFMSAFSIGFRVFDVEKTEGKPPIVKDAELFELSTVIIPANTDAMVKTVEHANRVLKMHGHEAKTTIYAKQGYADTIRTAAAICRDVFHKRAEGADIPDDLRAEIENLQLYLVGIAGQEHKPQDEVSKALTDVLDFFKSRGRAKGRRLAAAIRAALEAIEDREERARVRAAAASAAGISEATLDGIISGEIVRPPDNRLRGIARAIPGLSFDQLRRLADQDAA